MPPTLTRYRRAPSRNLGGGLLVGAGVAAVIVVAMAFVPALRLPATVDRLTVSNPTEYGLEIDVSDPSRDGWLTLGGFSPVAKRTVYEVLDQGNNWVFRFRYAGQEMGQVAMTRSALARAGWQLNVPRELGDRLWASGAPVSARG
jgi:hypothetical protein